MPVLLIPTLFCPKPWERMPGNDTIRFCDYCKKHVHNLAAMSVSERLALLSSPAASICSRYKIAIRRPVPGREQAYWQRVLETAPTALLTTAAIVVLWQMQAPESKRTFFRAVAGLPGLHDAIPSELYEEREVFVLGAMAICPPAPPVTTPTAGIPAPSHVDLDLDPAEIERLLKTAPPPMTAPVPVASLDPPPVNR